MHFGLYSNWEKHGPTNSRTDSCYSSLPMSVTAETTSAPNFASRSQLARFRSPWQNGVAERWVGSCRRDLLDHVIILNERHLKRLMSSLCLAKTSYTCRMNDLVKDWIRIFPLQFLP